MKRFLLCGLLSLCVCLSASAGLAQWPLGKDITPTSKDQESGGHVTGTGRFQIFVSPQAKGFTFMLDADNGRVWVMKKDHSSGDFSFQRVPVQDADGEKPPSKGEKPPSKGEKPQ